MNCVKCLQSPVGYIGIPLQAVPTFCYRIGSNLNKQKERNDVRKKFRLVDPLFFTREIPVHRNFATWQEAKKKNLNKVNYVHK